MKIKKTMCMMTLLAAGATAFAATDAERIALLEAKVFAEQPATELKQSLEKMVDKISIYGDVRVGFEYIGDDEFDHPNKVKDSMFYRARLNFDVNLDDNWLAAMQLSTMSSDTSRDATVNKNYSSQFTQAYLRYTPIPEVGIYGGVMPQPWYAVSDLIWDTDVTLGGTATKAGFDFAEYSVFASAGFFQMDDTLNDVEKDAGGGAPWRPMRLYSAQLGGAVDMDESAKICVGGGLFYWDNLEGIGTGRNMDDPTYNVNSFQEFELFAALSGASKDLPYSIFGQYVYNPNGDEDKYGYLLGVTVGKATKRKVQLGYDYRYLGRDAVLDARRYSDGASWGGGTDGKGHRLQVRYGITDSVQVGAAGYFAKKNVSTDDATNYKRFMLDVTATF